MLNLDYRKKDFTTDSILQHNLSIQFNLDGFSFWLKDKISREIVLFKHIPLRLSNDSVLIKKIQQILDSEAEFKQPPAGPTIIFTSSKFTLIPSFYFVPEHAGEFLEFICGPIINSTIGWEYTSDNEYAIVYSIPDHFRNIFENKFDNPVYCHILRSFLDYANYLGSQYKNSVLTFFVPGGIYLALLLDNKICFHNYFEFRHIDDLNFYLLSVFRQFGISPDKIPVFLSGSIDRKPELIIQGAKRMNADFIRMVPPTDEVFSKIPFHRFFNL